ncbi:MAG: hypothetical protein MJK15_01780 [Colwellia sp.]|nr:hypothetical protein [Colwellia sp.]
MSFDYINGEKVPQTFIHEDYELVGTHNGTVNVESGKFILHGKLQGTLCLNSNEPTEIYGEQQGTVSLSGNSHVFVNGTIQGTTTIPYGATLIIESTGKLQGTLSNDGTVILRGVFGGVTSGTGQIITEGNGYIKEPVVRNGINYY